MNSTILALLLTNVFIMSSIFNCLERSCQTIEEQDRQVCPVTSKI